VNVWVNGCGRIYAPRPGISHQFRTICGDGSSSWARN